MRAERPETTTAAISLKRVIIGPVNIRACERPSNSAATDPALRADGDVIRVPTAPGLGITIDARAEKSLRVAAEA
jgi:L-alanine-DL-glutamate epimerase-like enolase superfamily enzyme